MDNLPKERLDQDFIAQNALLEVLGLAKSTLGRLIREKGFPVIRLGAQVKIFYEPAIVEWLKTQMTPKRTQLDEDDRIL